MSAPIVKAEGLARFYDVKEGFLSKTQTVRALAGVDFELSPGKTLAIVGESGCGKSTLARLITMIEEPSAGRLTLDGTEVRPDTWASLRETVQIVFQDPYGSLNPRQKIGTILMEPLVINRPQMPASEREASAREMMDLVGLRSEHFDRYPHMFSGGQRQRISIARALMLNPKILVLDEPVSALDVSIQSQILNLLVELQDRLGLAYLFISHDLSVVKHFADDVIVMYLGRAVEKASKQTLFAAPRHPYSKALLSTTPRADPEAKKDRIKLEGELPSPLNVPPGCAFAPRCWLATDTCRAAMPPMEGETGHQVACYHPL
ncbi:dipeptide ABC transporter ATP-binding protein [Aliisedimentitalea scapharcae]|uniref:Dipeptide ABC transporter ATP-binding protein n=1 Tax=Aliisedimentitalea scapharcae TaxID=1524259 RepID=A0ABZ2XW56_9RHOB